MMKNSLNCPKFKIEANKFVVFKIQLLGESKSEIKTTLIMNLNTVKPFSMFVFSTFLIL